MRTFRIISIPFELTKVATLGKATLGGVYQGGDGLLWVPVAVADPGWKYSPPGIATNSGFARNIDVMLAVIDPKTGELLAERRLPGAIGFLGRRDLIFTAAEHPDGYVFVDIWRVSLKRQ